MVLLLLHYSGEDLVLRQKDPRYRGGVTAVSAAGELERARARQDHDVCSELASTLEDAANAGEFEYFWKRLRL